MFPLRVQLQRERSTAERTSTLGDAQPSVWLWITAKPLTNNYHSIKTPFRTHLNSLDKLCKCGY